MCEIVAGFFWIFQIQKAYLIQGLLNLVDCKQLAYMGRLKNLLEFLREAYWLSGRIKGVWTDFCGLQEKQNNPSGCFRAIEGLVNIF